MPMGKLSTLLFLNIHHSVFLFTIYIHMNNEYIGFAGFFTKQGMLYDKNR